MSEQERCAELDRCDREIAEIRTRPDVVANRAPAWLVTLGIEDWLMEKRLIEADREVKSENGMSDMRA